MQPKKWGLLVELILIGVILLTGVVSIFCILNKPQLKTEKENQEDYKKKRLLYSVMNLREKK